MCGIMGVSYVTLSTYSVDILNNYSSSASDISFNQTISDQYQFPVGMYQNKHTFLHFNKAQLSKFSSSDIFNIFQPYTKYLLHMHIY